MKLSLPEKIRCIINVKDKNYAEWSTNVKLFPHEYNSQIKTTFGFPFDEMISNQKPRKLDNVYPERNEKYTQKLPTNNGLRVL